MAERAHKASHRSSFLSRACENCRLRKIRCDKAIPCSSCQTLGITCQAATRQVEPRPRMVVSGQYEKQIELIQERLRTIEMSVKEISRSSQRSQSPPREDLLGQSTKGSPPASITAFEGDSSFGTSTLEASKAADLAVERVLGENQEVAAALSALRDSLQSHETDSRVHYAYLSNQQGPSKPFRADIRLLPVEFVIALVKKYKVAPPLCLVTMAAPEHIDVEKLCQKIYFPSEPIPPGSVTLMHALLYYIMRDYAEEDYSDLSEFDLATYKDICEKNLYKGLETYETLVTPTLENIQSLLLGASKAQEDSKISLCWSYVSAAQNMCQTLGYHRKSALRNDTFKVAEAKRNAFWNLYMLDKNLSLNLGRASNFRDYDIDAEFFTPCENPLQRPWDQMALGWVKFATVQGEVYDQLYSAQAARSPPEGRLRAIQELSSRLLTVRDEIVSVDYSRGYFCEYVCCMDAATDFITYSVLTIIYRAQAIQGHGTEISGKCFEAAKLSLQNHLRCFEDFRRLGGSKQTDYVNWVLLYPSFTPFVIVFTHAIGTTDLDDLALLSETVHSLDMLKHLCHGSKRLFNVCKAFLNAAEALINSRQTLSGLHQHDNGSLVLSPGTNPQTQQMPISDFVWPTEDFNFGASNMDMSAFLSGWLGANRPVTEMLNLEFGEHDTN
ncbi:C6 transcription factor [Lineolata rhizophorae]|uniref:C6 transcription factor n=1 Tax=Lineolata rhizophorae TaxID=578093 RepID=A0A6A6NL99_9PEZI|nr:C6 transcription factor [Lineolata rhizophorae]